MATSVLTLEGFARAILLGDRLEDKLINLSVGTPDVPGAALDEIPRFPGRPPPLARIGKAEFPKLDRLAKSAAARGQVLHFFANHELLAMELMALLLLRFPGAPPDFRAGIARTISEEQEHLKLYHSRMRELGVELGDLPVSDYFWNAMKEMSSPLQFVTQMSLTLEQANLDFSLFYTKKMEQAGDTQTAALLERVYREEIGHVKHGLHWFNRWRNGSAENSSDSGNIGASPGNLPGKLEDDWDAYLRLLPPPMTPRRAKGHEFAAEPRRQAGFSERYIRELEVYGGSKGRPPVFWLYNPLCDAEIARGRPGLTPTATVQNLGLDLEPLLMNLASEQDVVLVHELPRAPWLKQMRELGFTVPEFRVLGKTGESPRENKIGGVEPWGWSPEVFERFKHWRERLIGIPGQRGTWAAALLGHPDFPATGLGDFFSKSWSTAFLRRWLTEHPEDQPIYGQPKDQGQTYTDWESAREALIQSFAVPGKTLLAKAPWGTSGTQNKRVLKPEEIDGALGAWIRGVIQTQGAIVLEPWLEKSADLSIQLEIADQGVQLKGIRYFRVGAQLEYLGTELDPKLTRLDPESLRFLHSDLKPIERWNRFARAVGQELSRAGYRGPAGIDAMIWKCDGQLRLKPMVELNPRWTMGRIALAIESRVLPSRQARWLYVRRREIPAGLGFAAWARELQSRHPVRQVSAGGGYRICEGVIFTTDPETVREVLTVLAVGEKACSEIGITGA